MREIVGTYNVQNTTLAVCHISIVKEFELFKILHICKAMWNTSCTFHLKFKNPEKTTGLTALCTSILNETCTGLTIQRTGENRSTKNGTRLGTTLNPVTS
jgi:hypothetical protein